MKSRVFNVSEPFKSENGELQRYDFVILQKIETGTQSKIVSCFANAKQYKIGDFCDVRYSKKKNKYFILEPKNEEK